MIIIKTKGAICLSNARPKRGATVEAKRTHATLTSEQEADDMPADIGFLMHE